jgi:serine/threonine-protein kinase ULK/ATG1
MAPEVYEKRSYDSKVDVWSLGTILFEMTHGRSPFQVRNAAELAEARKHKVLCD